MEHLLIVMAVLEVIRKMIPKEQQLLDNPYSLLKLCHCFLLPYLPATKEDGKELFPAC